MGCQAHFYEKGFIKHVNMKKKLMVAFLAFSIVACKPNASEADKAETTNANTAEDAVQHESLALNNGKKWHVNEDMKPHILASEALLTEFLAQQNEDYQSLAENLKTQNKALISSCTMTGPSHDALHHWLHPHLDLVKLLATADDTASASEVLLDIQFSFQKYHQFFE